MAEHGAQDEEDGGRQAGLPAHFRGQEVESAQWPAGSRRRAGRSPPCPRRDGDEGGQEGAQDAADGVAGPQCPRVLPLSSRLSTVYFTREGVTVPSRKQGKTKITMQAQKAAMMRKLVLMVSTRPRRCPG